MSNKLLPYHTKKSETSDIVKKKKKYHALTPFDTFNR